MHTQTPWKLDLGLGAPEIVGNGRRIARVLYEGGSEDNEVEVNAQFIVRACNSHEELVDALTNLLAHPEDKWFEHEAFKAIAKAKS